MQLNDLYSLVLRVAPISLSDEYCKTYDGYDNSGIIIDAGQDVTKIMFSLDLNLRVVKMASANKANCIITHHPAIFKGIKNILTQTDEKSKAIAECIKRGISVISMHLNFDVVKGGIDDKLMLGLGGKTALAVMDTVQDGGYGKVFDVQGGVFSDYVANVFKTFNTEKSIYYGDSFKEVNRVASFCGAGADEKAVKFAIDNKADVFVSSDFKHHIITSLLDNGINVICLTHYSAEYYGFSRMAQTLIKNLHVPGIIYIDKGLM